MTVNDVFGTARASSRDGERHRLGEQLDIAIAHYEFALRRSNVTMFRQDTKLRYLSISNDFAGRSIGDIIGRTDADILACDGCDAVTTLKQQALASGEPQDGEVDIRPDGNGVQWLDLHIEPLRNETGMIVGLVGIAVDITRRKEDEEHLRLMLREITHRSKNLLAVIQAMARQTARHAKSVDGFMVQLGARLQALAASHDALVEKGWHGASLAELVALQLQPFVESLDGQISIEGPTVLLKPEAAQALGLALHELANNAKKFGALSVPQGRVSISWVRLPHPEGDGVDLKWIESGGPVVVIPSARRFGSLAIERNLERAANGTVKLEFLPAGVECDIVIPPQHFVDFVERSPA